MTKTIIAIGLGLLAAIYAPAKTVLAQTPVAFTSGPDGEVLEFQLMLLVAEEADCAGDRIGVGGVSACSVFRIGPV